MNILFKITPSTETEICMNISDEASLKKIYIGIIKICVNVILSLCCILIAIIIRIIKKYIVGIHIFMKVNTY